MKFKEGDKVIIKSKDSFNGKEGVIESIVTFDVIDPYEVKITETGEDGVCFREDELEKIFKKKKR